MRNLADLELDALRDYVRDLLHERGEAARDIDRRRQELPYHPLLVQYQQGSENLRDRLRRASLALLEEATAEPWSVERLHHLLTFIEEAGVTSAIEPLKNLVNAEAFREQPEDRRRQMLALRTLLGLGWHGDPNFWLRQNRYLAHTCPALIFRALAAHGLELAFTHLAMLAASPEHTKQLLQLFPGLIEKHSLEKVGRLTQQAVVKVTPEVARMFAAWFERRGYGPIPETGVAEGERPLPEGEGEQFPAPPSDIVSPERWQRFKEVVVAVLEQNQQEWPTYLLAQCGDDVDLFLDASSLLAASRSMGDFIEAPAWQVLMSPAERASWR